MMKIMPIVMKVDRFSLEITSEEYNEIVKGLRLRRIECEKSIRESKKKDVYSERYIEIIEKMQKLLANSCWIHMKTGTEDE